MPVSKAQLEVWKARAKLDRKLAKMTPRQRRAYLNGSVDRVRRRFGIDLSHLREKDVASEPVRSRS